jgi:ABC-type Fe3+ transport system permease subunit
MSEEPYKIKIPWSLTIVLALIVAVPVFFIAWFAGSWLSNLWFNYAWASDKGNGPEAIQQTVVYAAIAAILIPAVRRFLKFEFERLHTKIEKGQDEMHDHLHHLHDQLGLERFERPEKT